MLVIIIKLTFIKEFNLKKRKNNLKNWINLYQPIFSFILKIRLYTETKLELNTFARKVFLLVKFQNNKS